MKIQLALDDISMDMAMELLDKVSDFLEIAEAGTPFLMRYGMEGVRKLRDRYPSLQILCDGKIMDAGSCEAELAFQAGADYVTVLAVTDDRTIQDVVSMARKYGKKTVADMICVENLEERAKELDGLGVDVVAVHTGVDQQAAGRTPLGDLRVLRKAGIRAQLAVAGGIRLSVLEEYLQYEPEIIIVGGGIVHADDPAGEAKKLAEKIHGWMERKGSVGAKAYTGKILEELTKNQQYLQENELQKIVEEILGAGYIFTAGAGRSRTAIQAFTNRLMHLGLSVSLAGEISAPHTKAGDLLIIGSGSGETESLVAMAKKAKRNGMRIALFTMDEGSAIGRIADAVAVLPGASPKLRQKGKQVSSIQPMGSAFEQLCFLVCDGIILELMDRMGQTSEEMFERHTDLE